MKKNSDFDRSRSSFDQLLSISRILNLDPSNPELKEFTAHDWGIMCCGKVCLTSAHHLKDRGSISRVLLIWMQKFSFLSSRIGWKFTFLSSAYLNKDSMFWSRQKVCWLGKINLYCCFAQSRFRFSLQQQNQPYVWLYQEVWPGLNTWHKF